jgi:nitroreductase
MNVIDALNSRYTCRAFKQDPVAQDTVIKILEAANRTPSWGNTQPWNLYVAAGELLEELRKGSLERFSQKVAGKTDLPVPQEWPEALKQRYITVGKERYELLSQELDKDAIIDTVQDRNYRFFDAPVVIFICMNRNLTAYSMFDLGALSQSMMLAAQEYGLDTAPAIMLVQYPDMIRQAMDIPEEEAIVLGIALGYGDSSSIHNQHRTARRPIHEVAKLKGF